ncbi:MAG: winged helix-turn-helix domain-containing protein [Candidatus Bathyarchaeia archaeon]
MKRRLTEDLSRYYTLLRDPARRKIIEILGTQEKIGFKELREALGLGVGTVYYHLDMLSDFITQDKQRKYRLNDRGQALYKVLKEGNVPASLEIGEALSHRFAKWIFLSPVFAKTVKPLVFLPLALAILLLGGFGAASAGLDSALFFYFPYSAYDFTSLIALYIFNWIGLFLFTEMLALLIYRRVGNDLQLLTCLLLASLPLAIFPYVYPFTSEIFLIIVGLKISVSTIILFILQIWTLLLVSAALCFGKGLRLDKAIVISLTAIYINMAMLFFTGRFT